VLGGWAPHDALRYALNLGQAPPTLNLRQAPARYSQKSAH